MVFVSVFSSSSAQFFSSGFCLGAAVRGLFAFSFEGRCLELCFGLSLKNCCQ